jgi:DNA modification methylase
MLDINKVHHMSCIDGMKQMDAESVDLVVTSPPYDQLRAYNDSSSWNFDVFKEVADGLIRVLKPGGVICWNVADAVVKYHKKQGTSKSGSSFRQCLYFQENGLNFHDNLIYAKHGPRFPAGKAGTRYSNVYEYVFVMSKGTPEHVNLLVDKPNKTAGIQGNKTGGGRNAKTGEIIKTDKGKRAATQDMGVRFNIWVIGNVFGGTGQTDRRAYEHPALMPNGLANDCIRSYSNEGDLVLDPFMGSGTTARQAAFNGRDFIGFEIDENYHKLCNEITQDAIDKIEEEANQSHPCSLEAFM